MVKAEVVHIDDIDQCTVWYDTQRPVIRDLLWAFGGLCGASVKTGCSQFSIRFISVFTIKKVKIYVGNF